MPARARPPDELSAGGVAYRLRPGDPPQVEVVLIRVGRAWSFPKGNLDRGETPEQAALREVAEETGLPIELLAIRGRLPAAEYAYRRRDGRLIFKRVEHFLIEVNGDAALVPQAAEVDEVAWVALDEAERRVAYRDLRAALAATREAFDRATDPGPGG